MNSSAQAFVWVLGSIVLVFVLIIVAGIVWWNSYVPNMQKDAASHIEQGRSEGKHATEQICLNAAVARSKQMKDLDLEKAIFNTSRLIGCLEESSLSASFCEGVPSQDSPMEAGDWVAKQCLQKQLGQVACQTVFQILPNYCHSEKRKARLAEKTTQADKALL